MRVLTKSSHDDHDLGSVYECDDEALLARLLAGGLVVPAAEWTFRYEPPQNSAGDCRYIFERVAPPAVAEVAPAPAVPAAEGSVAEIAPAPVTPAAPALVTRAEANPEE